MIRFNICRVCLEIFFINFPIVLYRSALQLKLWYWHSRILFTQPIVFVAQYYISSCLRNVVHLEKKILEIIYSYRYQAMKQTNYVKISSQQWSSKLIIALVVLGASFTARKLWFELIVFRAGWGLPVCEETFCLLSFPLTRRNKGVCEHGTTDGSQPMSVILNLVDVPQVRLIVQKLQYW